MINTFIILLLFVYSFNLNNLQNSYETLKIPDLIETKFSFEKEYIVLEYKNNYEKFFNSNIFFIFKTGKRSSTKIYLYDSLNSITKGESGFINSLYETTLKEARYFKISSSDFFYKDKTTYYIVLYDISNRYTDYIYVLNSLNYFHLNKDFSFMLNFNIELNFNFIIQNDNNTYFHYQARGKSGSSSNSYHFIIKNSKGEDIVDNHDCGTSINIKLSSNEIYYVQITIRGNDDNYENPEFGINFEKYGYNIFLEEGKEKKLKVLYPQHFTFFKDITNLLVNETLIIKFKIDSSSFHKDRFFIKYYDSGNFEQLVNNSIPIYREDFDYSIGSFEYGGGDFNYELTKIYDSQKGVLFGVYFDPEFYWSMQPTYISINIEEKKKNEKKDKSKEEIKDNNSLGAGGIVAIIFSCIIFLLIVCCCCGCCKKEKDGVYLIIFFRIRID